jgi:hypothetical protein
LNIDALSKNLVNTTEEDEDFGCDVMEHEVRVETASPHFGEDSHNEPVINLFTLHLVDKEVADEELDQMGDKEQNVNYLSIRRIATNEP